MTTNDNLNQVANRVLDGIESAYDTLLATIPKLAEPAKYVYEKAVINQKLLGYQFLIPAVLVMVLSITAFSLALRLYLINGKDGYSNSERRLNAIGCMVVSTLTMVICSIVGWNGITHLINPEYYAMREIAAIAMGQSGGCR